MNEVDVLGVDLSKNHYGICHIDKDDNIHFIYSYFKPFLKKDYKTRNTQWYSVIERSETIGKFSFEKIRFNYDDKNYNEIKCDALKSELNVKSLTAYLENIKNETKLIVLEDYVMSGQKIVQLVHVTESFKYHLKNKQGLILFICPVSTWRKYMWSQIELKTDDPYEKINKALELYHKEVRDFIHNLGEPWDVVKEMIDSYGLANIKNHYGELFLKTYTNRIYIF